LRNIKRIIFRDLLKFDGKELRYISFPQVKQIAGRAGRFGTIHDNGIVTTLYSRDLDYIKEAIASPIVPLES
jgi:ATP-dependent RNA helicase SUPV3L1/SUV3